MRFTVTGGQVADITQAQALIEQLQLMAALADKAYDADVLLAYIDNKDANIVVAEMSVAPTLEMFVTLPTPQRSNPPCCLAYDLSKIVFDIIGCNHPTPAKYPLKAIRAKGDLIWIA